MYVSKRLVYNIKLTIKGVYSPGEAVRTKAEITWKKLGQCFTEEIRAEFRNFQKA